MKHIRLKIFTAILLLGLLSACQGAPVRTAEPSSIPPTPSGAAPTATSAPSATPQPGKVLLILPAGVDGQPLQVALTQAVQNSDLTFEARPDLPQADPAAKAVVFLSAPSNLNDLLAASPHTQYVVVSAADLPAAPNLSVIRQRADTQAFVAGFISVLLSTDFRGAGLLANDTPQSATVKDAFLNGGHYFCGVCAPGWPLRMVYPQTAELPAASDAPAWQSAVDGLLENSKAQVFYISAEAASPDLFAYLQGKTDLDSPVILLGTQSPPEALRPQWAATLRFDVVSALSEVLPNALAGKGGALVDAPLLLEDVNADVLGAGRLRLVQALMEDLQTGKVYPLSVPVQ